MVTNDDDVVIIDIPIIGEEEAFHSAESELSGEEKNGHTLEIQQVFHIGIQSWEKMKPLLNINVFIY